ncbi:hypothetical protein LTR84_008218 [Exophiala bonariae]|uniref:RING-type domain-containing protein n=1 Tax=Exophiala bonariae TaxID=1690606 RepID=A0AAV9N0R1_9EURO|nr:hypothetical protein LTR84_008218 [Exophiala bonariae]
MAVDSVLVSGGNFVINSHNYDVTENECLICHEVLVHEPSSQKIDNEEPGRMAFEPSEECSSCKRRTHTYCLAVWFNKAYTQKCPHCRVEVAESYALQIIEAGLGEWEAKNWKNWKDADVYWQHYYDSGYDDQSDSGYNYEATSESESASDGGVDAANHEEGTSRVNEE